MQQMGFRAVLFRMVPKRLTSITRLLSSFRAVLFRMVPKPICSLASCANSFRAVLFRMVPKRRIHLLRQEYVLELCCFEWFQNSTNTVEV